jgi:hypothetical protein
VALQIDDLCNCTTMNTLRRTLNSLPKTLDETYHCILNKNKVNEYNQSLVQHILQVVCFSQRPLAVEELGHIYCIGDQRKPPFESEDALFRPEDVVYLCGGLLYLVLSNEWDAGHPYHSLQCRDVETVQLAHFSVKEYLLSARAMSWKLDEELSHLYIVKAGIASFLEFMDSRDVKPDDNLLGRNLIRTEWDPSLKNHSLAIYCASYTSDHLSQLNPRDHPDLTESFRYLLDPRQSTLSRKIGLWYFYKWFHPPSTLDVEPLEVSTLRIAAQLGLPVTCQWLLSINTLAQISSTSPEHGIGFSIIFAAAHVQCHVDVLRILLAAGGDIDQYIPFLYMAISTCSREIVEVLIDLGIDVNMQDRGYSPMDLALIVGDEDIVKVLHDAGG